MTHVHKVATALAKRSLDLPVLQVIHLVGLSVQHGHNPCHGAGARGLERLMLHFPLSRVGCALDR